jgi:hypothetical protein
MNDSLASKQMLIIRRVEGTATRSALNACVYCMLPPSKRFEIFVKEQLVDGCRTAELSLAPLPKSVCVFCEFCLDVKTQSMLTCRLIMQVALTSSHVYWHCNVLLQPTSQIDIKFTLLSRQYVLRSSRKPPQYRPNMSAPHSDTKSIASVLEAASDAYTSLRAAVLALDSSIDTIIMSTVVSKQRHLLRGNTPAQAQSPQKREEVRLTLLHLPPLLEAVRTQYNTLVTNKRVLRRARSKEDRTEKRLEKS